MIWIWAWFCPCTELYFLQQAVLVFATVGDVGVLLNAHTSCAVSHVGDHEHDYLDNARKVHNMLHPVFPVLSVLVLCTGSRETIWNLINTSSFTVSISCWGFNSRLVAHPLIPLSYWLKENVAVLPSLGQFQQVLTNNCLKSIRILIQYIYIHIIYINILYYIILYII
jgi:hypothetical protein